MSDKKKLTLEDFPDEPYLNATDLQLRQQAADRDVPPEAPAESDADSGDDTVTKKKSKK